MRQQEGKTNFFERKVGEYQKNGVMAGLSGGQQNSNEFTLDAEYSFYFSLAAMDYSAIMQSF